MFSVRVVCCTCCVCYVVLCVLCVVCCVCVACVLRVLRVVCVCVSCVCAVCAVCAVWVCCVCCVSVCVCVCVWCVCVCFCLFALQFAAHNVNSSKFCSPELIPKFLRHFTRAITCFLKKFGRKAIQSNVQPGGATANLLPPAPALATRSPSCEVVGSPRPR